jgi:hypothetical protein
MASPEVTANAQQVIPTAAAGASLNASATPWADGTLTVLSASTPAAWTAVGFVVNEPNASGDYEIELLVGGAGVEVPIAVVGGYTPPSVSGSAWNLLEFRVPVDSIPSGARVTCRLRKAGTNTTAWGIKLIYYNTVTSTVGITTNVPAVAPAAAAGVVVATNTGSWVNSDWVEVHAGLTNVALLSLVINTVSTGDDFEFDVGTGTAGNEVVAGTLGFSAQSSTGSRHHVPFCIPIRLFGTHRISVRVRRAAAAASLNTTVRLNYVSTSGFHGNGLMQYTTALSAVVADAAALAVVAGSAVAWTNSLWVELIASTATAIVVTGVVVDPAAVVVEWEVDIGVGAALSEVVVGTIGDMTHSNVGVDNTVNFAIPIDAIPASSRVVARVRKTGTSTANWGLGIEYVPKPLAA